MHLRNGVLLGLLLFFLDSAPVAGGSLPSAGVPQRIYRHPDFSTRTVDSLTRGVKIFVYDQPDHLKQPLNKKKPSLGSPAYLRLESELLAALHRFASQSQCQIVTDPVQVLCPCAGDGGSVVPAAHVELYFWVSTRIPYACCQIWTVALHRCCCSRQEAQIGQDNQSSAEFRTLQHKKYPAGDARDVSTCIPQVHQRAKEGWIPGFSVFVDYGEVLTTMDAIKESHRCIDIG